MLFGSWILWFSSLGKGLKLELHDTEAHVGFHISCDASISVLNSPGFVLLFHTKILMEVERGKGNSVFIQTPYFGDIQKERQATHSLSIR